MRGEDMGYTKEEKAMIWIDSFSPDYAKKARLLQAFRDPYAVAEQFYARSEEIGGIVGERVLEEMRASLEGGANELFSAYRSQNIVCVTCFSALYPDLLRTIENPPFVLYCKGDVSLLQERKFAVVGSRRTLANVLQRTERIAEELSRAFVIVSGLADGGDTAALSGALRGGKAISVLAFGFSHVCPESNRALLEKVIKNGLAVSEYVPSQPAMKYSFPARNRIIAGLSEGVLVVSGGEKSGTRITAGYAYDYGRDVFAFPYNIGEETGVCCNRLIKDYAKLTENSVDIASAFGINLTEKEPEPLTRTEELVLSHIGASPTHTSEIAAKTGMKEAELSPVLMLLCMKKRIVSCGGNRWGKVK